MSRQSSAEFCHGTLCCETLRKYIIVHVLQSVNMIAGYTPPTIWHGRAIHLDSPAHMLNRIVYRCRRGCLWAAQGEGWLLQCPVGSLWLWLGAWPPLDSGIPSAHVLIPEAQGAKLQVIHQS